jgi:malonate transporter MadL subunit
MASSYQWSTLSPFRRLSLEQPLVIYGVAFLAGCMIAGLFLGEVLGTLMGVQANVGGVGIAMLIMILLSDRLRKAGKLTKLTERGVLFWSSIYIPIVVAMAAKQNVTAAVKGGPAAILAGAGAVVVSFLLVPVLSRVTVAPAVEEGSEGSAQTAPEEPGA